ncbi:MAG: hypothetical protein AABZ12_09895 [Planctomycetota bacterium]
MWGRGGHFGRRRRRGHPIAVALLLAVFLGWDQLARALQERQVWQGTIVRTYQDRGFLHGRKSRMQQYWEVQTNEGEVRSIRVYTEGLWTQGNAGDRVCKQAGVLEASLSGR